MGVAGGLFNIIQRSQLSATATATLRVTQTHQKTRDAGEASTNPLTWTKKKNESAVAAFWRLAPDKAAEKAPSVDIVKRLEKMADDKNADISAEKMRQAKAKLEGLCRQLQMLAASGDVRQLRRIAAEAAQLAREIGAAARAMAQGIGAGTVSTDTSSAQATANAASNAASSVSGGAGETSVPASGTEATPGAAATDPANGDHADDPAAARAQAFKALHELTSDARNAITKAKGIIALAAQMARAKRKSGDDDDSYFRKLQDLAEAGLEDVEAGQREALQQLVMPALGSGEVFSETVSTEISLEVSVTASVSMQTTVAIVA